MSRLTSSTIFVEGKDDEGILARWFDHLKFEAVGGKDKIHKKVEQNPRSWGLLDRDFANEQVVNASRLPESRVIVLRRYCIENYLLEPTMVATVAGQWLKEYPVLQPWIDQTYIIQQLLRWGTELAIYAAANRLIAEWKTAIEGDFARYFGPLPPLPHKQVLTELYTRLAKLPDRTELEGILAVYYDEIRSDVSTLGGVHRWINGKVLLEGFLHPQGFKLHNFAQSRLRSDLIEAGRHAIPEELNNLEQLWSAKANIQ